MCFHGCCLVVRSKMRISLVKGSKYFMGKKLVLSNTFPDRPAALVMENSLRVLTSPAVMSHFPRQLIRRRLLRHLHLWNCGEGKNRPNEHKQTGGYGRHSFLALILPSRLLCNRFQTTL